MHIAVLMLALMTIATSASAQAQPAAKPIKLVVLGDSLSAGLGLPAQEAFPAKLQKALRAKGIDIDMVNAGVSGDTSSGGRDRLDWSVAEGTEGVIVELGANDGLRGLPVAQMKENLTAVVRAAQRARAKVLLIGMRLPPNYGRPYIDEFRRAFQEVAGERNIALVPFLLEGMADKPNLFQADNLHPVAEAQPVLLENVWRGLAPLLAKPAGR